MTHCRSLLLRPRSLVMAGAATSSDVLAMTMISRLRQRTASAAQRRGYGRSMRSTGVVATNMIDPLGKSYLHTAVQVTQLAHRCATIELVKGVTWVSRSGPGVLRPTGGTSW